MATTTSKKHLSKRELKEDKLMSFLGDAYEFLNARRSAVLFSAVGLVALVLVVGLYKNSAKAGESRSEEILYLALTDYEAGRYREASNGLTQFVDRFPRHKRIGVAQTTLGNVHLVLNELADAKSRFEKGLSDSERGSATWVAAKSGLGAVAAAQGLMDEAAKNFEEAAAASTSKEAGAEAISEAIRARIAAGQAPAAKTLLDKAKRDYEGTRAAQHFARLEGELNAIGG
ncbi:MAG: hypothetical protein ACKVU1_09155 [bacterium]